MMPQNVLQWSCLILLNWAGETLGNSVMLSSVRFAAQFENETSKLSLWGDPSALLFWFLTLPCNLMKLAFASEYERKNDTECGFKCVTESISEAMIWRGCFHGKLYSKPSSYPSCIALIPPGINPHWTQLPFQSGSPGRWRAASSVLSASNVSSSTSSSS